MPRAAWKGEFKAIELWKRLRVANRRGAWVTWARRSSVFRELVGCDMRVHCGKEFSSALIGQEHIGCKLGSLALSKVIGSNIHRFNRLSQKKKKVDELVRQRKVRKLRVKKNKVVGKSKKK